jgi:hypothetical protein
MNTPQLKISFDYLQRENLKGNYVHDWIKSYAKRNKIELGAEEGTLLIKFKSTNQKEWFVRRGNNKFPYFEFW